MRSPFWVQAISARVKGKKIGVYHHPTRHLRTNFLIEQRGYLGIILSPTLQPVRMKGLYKVAPDRYHLNFTSAAPGSGSDPVERSIQSRQAVVWLVYPF